MIDYQHFKQKSLVKMYQRLLRNCLCFSIFVANAFFLTFCKNEPEMGTYSFDKQFLRNNGVETVELSSEDGLARVLMAPAWQGRVATSTADGETGQSFGWINHKFIESGERSLQFNNFGGEERFWLGPEGGENSWFFAPGAEQVFANWKVPDPFDTDVFDIEEKTDSSVVFHREVTLHNAKGKDFRMEMRRRVTLLGKKDLEAMDILIPEDCSFVAYTSENTISNKGAEAWTEESGMPSVWMLGMFNVTEGTTVYIPYNQEGEGAIVKDDYFGPMPEGRVRAENGMIEFKIDGKFRSKIGVNDSRSMGKVIASDPIQGITTMLITAVPEPGARYVNSQWGVQDNAFGGDALNSYNDGPTEDGTIMGPFYEIESSSPAAALSPGESLTHKQTTVHIKKKRS